MDRIDSIHTNTFHLVKKIVKIGPVDPEIALLYLKKKEINASKIYSPVGPVSRFAERAKLLHRFQPNFANGKEKVFHVSCALGAKSAIYDGVVVKSCCDGS